MKLMRGKQGVTQARNAAGRAKGFGGCLRCGGTWDYTQWHDTTYGDGSACFPLCETCWAGLTPETRLPYYAILHGEWLRGIAADPDPTARANEIFARWPLIEQAVLEGR